jgi:inositol-hexakisphosphate/diphosphoinositol-pentakisphosphate 1-kinase
LGKILIDLRNTREEALSVAEPRGQNEAPFDSKTVKDSTIHKRPHNDNRDERRSDENSMSEEDDEDKETKYRLDPKSVVYLFFVLFCRVPSYSECLERRANKTISRKV